MTAKKVKRVPRVKRMTRAEISRVARRLRRDWPKLKAQLDALDEARKLPPGFMKTEITI